MTEWLDRLLRSYLGLKNGQYSSYLNRHQALIKKAVLKLVGLVSVNYDWVSYQSIMVLFVHFNCVYQETIRLFLKLGRYDYINTLLSYFINYLLIHPYKLCLPRSPIRATIHWFWRGASTQHDSIHSCPDMVLFLQQISTACKLTTLIFNYYSLAITLLFSWTQTVNLYSCENSSRPRMTTFMFVLLAEGSKYIKFL